jgi:hypothetical protein
MRSLPATVAIVAAALLLADCTSENMSGASSSIPSAMHHSTPVSIVPVSRTAKTPMQLRGRQAPAQEMRGIYVAQYFGSSVLGYTKNNSGNDPFICSISGVGTVNDLATDTKGNLIVPNAFSGVNVYRGPQMCGPLLATIADPYGQASDAAAVNAATGPIVVGNIYGPGFVVVCTVHSLTCAELTPPSAGIGEVAGVGMDKNGNCWADSYNAAFTAIELTYWAGCTGTGIAATGFKNFGYGGVDIDNSGNVVTIDWHADEYEDLWVYSGCKPARTSVSDNQLPESAVIFGHIGRHGDRLVVAAYLKGQVDIYAYTPTTLTYYYSFANGLDRSADVEGVAYSPSSKK